MSVSEYLIALYEELKYLPKKKREQIINLYRDKMNTMLDSGEPELKVVSAFKSPQELANQIYHEEGIDYLTRYKKQKKLKDLFTIIISIALILLVVAAAFTLSYLLIYSIIKLSKLLFLLEGAFEIVLMSLLIVSYDITILLVLFYLVDLFLLTFNLLMDNIYKAIGTEYKLFEFSLTDILDNIFKKKHISSKILAGFAIGTIILFVCNFACKTYFYRSFTQTTPDNYSVDYYLDNFLLKNEIQLEIDEAIIYIKNGDEFKLTVQSEFERNVEFVESIENLKITTDKIKKFDFLNLLEEPLPVFTLYIPKDKNISINLTDGNIYIQDLVLNNLNIDILYGNAICNKISTNEVNVKTKKAGVNISGSNMGPLNVIAEEGQVYLNDNIVAKLNILTDNASLDFQKINAGNVKITNEQAKFYFNDINSSLFDLEINSASGEMKNIISQTDLKILAKLNSNITLFESTANNIDVSMNTGSFTGYYLNGNGKISTLGNAALKELNGSYDIVCLGRLLDIYDSKFDQLKIQTQNTQTMMQFVKANKIIYEGSNSQTVASLVFAKEIKLRDDRGDLNFDYDKSLTDDLEKYYQYYVKLEKLEISTHAIYRVENGVEFGEVK